MPRIESVGAVKPGQAQSPSVVGFDAETVAQFMARARNGVQGHRCDDRAGQIQVEKESLGLGNGCITMRPVAHRILCGTRFYYDSDTTLR